MKMAFLPILAVACGTSSTPLDRRTQAITGGDRDEADSAVVALVATVPLCGEGGPPPQIFCTGTLIAPRVVLTAAHCLTTYPLAGSRLYAGTDVAVGNETWLEVAAAVPHPAWQAAQPRVHDLALLLLEAPAPMQPIAPLAMDLATASAGATLRVVGFGVDDDGGVGVRRAGAVSLGRIGSDDFDIAAAPAMTCEGDSGGPLLLIRDGQTFVAGVTSFGDVDCHTGTDMRVDAALAGFLQPTLDAWSAVPARAPLAGDFCAATCAGDTDCPRGTACVPAGNDVRRCAISGLPPGTLGEACSTTCGGGGECVAGSDGCHCYRLCGTVHGCSFSTGSATDVGWPAMVLLGVLMTRFRRRSLVALFALVAVGCTDRGNCPAGAKPQGSPTTAQYCVDSAGQRQGPFVEWAPDTKPPAKLREGTYAGGQRTGKWTSFHPNGAVKVEEEYNGGKLDGRYTEYYDNGKKREEGPVAGGVRTGTWRMWHENGNLWRETEYSNNSLTQKWTVYSEAGPKTHAGVFVDGKKQGVFTEFYKSGKKSSEGPYADSKKEGIWTQWDETGAVKSQETWHDGNLVSHTP